MKKIILTFYFGELPNYIDIWLKGIGGNPDYDFLFYTDDETKHDYPSNMEVKYCSFDELRNKVQEHFDFTISMDKPYKFTDFKPAFGLIFEEEFKGYDYWGYVDQDVMLGNISKFITEDILKENDRVLTRDHFSIYRNTKEVSLRFKTESKTYGKLYKTVFESPKIYCFGERGHYGIYHIWIDNNWSIYDQPITADISYKKHYFELTDSQGFEDTQSEKQLFTYVIKDGQTTLIQHSVKNKEVHSREFLYMHLQKRKMSVERKKMNQKDLAFIIMPNKFIQLTKGIPEELTEKFVTKYIGRVNILKNYIRYYRRIKLKFIKYIKQFKY